MAAGGAGVGWAPFVFGAKHGLFALILIGQHLAGKAGDSGISVGMKIKLVEECRFAIRVGLAWTVGYPWVSKERVPSANSRYNWILGKLLCCSNQTATNYTTQWPLRPDFAIRSNHVPDFSPRFFSQIDSWRRSNSLTWKKFQWK